MPNFRIKNTLGQPTHEPPQRRRIDGQVIDESPVSDRLTGEPIPGATRPAPKPASQVVKTQAFAPLVKTGNPILLVPDKQAYQRVRLFSATAGVEISFSPGFAIATGQGMPLPTDEWAVLTMSPGDRLYIGTSTNATVSVVVEGMPWHEKITAGLAVR